RRNKQIYFSFNFGDVSSPTTRTSSFIDDTMNSSDLESVNFPGKENLPPIVTTPRHSIDSTSEQILPVHFQLYFADGMKSLKKRNLQHACSLHIMIL
ncbi:unnamed protein product, partial [Adineta steineri]